LLGRSLAEGCPEKYPAWVRLLSALNWNSRRALCARSIAALSWAARHHSPWFSSCAASPVFRQLMGDLFSGTQDYTSLKRRLWGHLGITVSEFISSVFEPGRTRQGHRARAGAAGD